MNNSDNPKSLGIPKLINFKDNGRQKVLDFIIKYMVEEDFPMKYLEAIAKIVSHFNEDEQTESSIFGFADRLGKPTPDFNIHVGDKVFTLKVIDGKLKVNSKHGALTISINAANSINLDQEDF